MTTRLSLVQKVSQVGATEFTVEVFLLDAVSVGSYQLEIEVLGLSSGVRYRYQSAGLVGMCIAPRRRPPPKYGPGETRRIPTGPWAPRWGRRSA